MITEDQIALFVLSSVCSVYPSRNSDVAEVLCDAGGLAMSKDQGPIPGHGKVRSDGKQGLEGWYLGRVSQEHGILTHSATENASSPSSVRLPEYGEKLRILPQHACMTLANHPWFYIVDSSLEASTDWQDWVVRDIWTPAKFW
jgi:D-serine deaminase-like pyridoxal phosphate-dependent protein